MRQALLILLSARAGFAIGFVMYLGIACCRLEAQEPRGAPSPASQAANSQGKKKMAFQITSSAFVQGHPIPKKYTGEGADVSPPLAWSGLPEGTKELALICDDPDAPTAEPWVHWVIYKIPADTKGLPEGVARKSRLKEPHGALQGQNSWHAGENIGYRGPMPPPGHGVHHYHFKLYALAAPIVVEPGLDKKTILATIDNQILATADLMGTYER